MFDARGSWAEAKLRRLLAAPRTTVELFPPPATPIVVVVRPRGSGCSADRAPASTDSGAGSHAGSDSGSDAGPDSSSGAVGGDGPPAGAIDVDEAVLTEFRAGLDADAALLGAARAARRTIGAAQAEQARALAAFAVRRPMSLDLPDDAVGSRARESRERRPEALTTISEFCVDEVAVALTVSGQHAERLLTECVLLVERLPLVLAALADGRVGWEHVRVACELLGGLSAELRERAQRELLGRAEGRTASDWRPMVRRWVMKADADAVVRRVARAVRDRKVTVHPGADGMGMLSVTLPLPVARAVEDALRTYAKGAAVPGDERTAGERMADCLAALVLDPGSHGMTAAQAQLTVVATVQALLGGDDPGEVDGDVVPAAMVRDLARALGLLPEDLVEEPHGGTADDSDTNEDDHLDAVADADAVPEAEKAVAEGATVDAVAALLGTRKVVGTALGGVPRIAVADEHTGELLALTDAAGIRRAVRDGTGLGPPGSTDGYRPGAVLDAFVRLRDRRCRFPGCRVRAGVCDVDHQQPWLRGGATAECNLACLCTHHHRLSHQAPGWRLCRDDDGTGLTWTTPTGQTITTRPPPVLDLGRDPGVPRAGAPGAERSGAEGAAAEAPGGETPSDAPGRSADPGRGGGAPRRDAVRAMARRRPATGAEPAVDATADTVDPPPF